MITYKRQITFGKELEEDYQQINPKKPISSRFRKFVYRTFPSMLISSKSNFKIYWDYSVLVLAIYNSLMIPFEQAFPNELTESTAVFYLDLVVDVIFVIDICLMFISTKINNKGKEIFDPYEIAKLYTSTRRFKFDFLSILGTQVFVNVSHFFKYFGFFKISRVFRLSEMIKRANTDTDKKALLNLIKLVFYLFFYLHLLACYKWIMLKDNGPTLYHLHGNNYENEFEEPMLDENGQPVERNEDYYWIFGDSPTFDEYEWDREPLDPSDTTFSERWSSRVSSWVAPLDWLNFEEAQLFKKETSITKRYLLMFYYSLLI